MTNDGIKQGVQQVAQALYEEHGKVTARQLVDAARPEESPAHAGFEWDDTKAAEEYRLNQGRRWLRITLIRRDEDSEPEPLINVPPIMTKDSEARDGEYQVLSVLVERPDEFQRALEQAQSKLSAARRAIEELYRAAEQTDRADQTAVIAQLAKATELWASALEAMH